MAAIALVPTPIAGIYGMNFDNMPEFRWQYGYFTVVGVIAVTCLAVHRMFHPQRLAVGNLRATAGYAKCAGPEPKAHDLLGNSLVAATFNALIVNSDGGRCPPRRVVA